MSETFKIYVGSPTNPGVCFEVSTILLTKHSGYFAARSRMTRGAPEHRRNIFLREDLSTDYASVFAVFVEWIETGDVLSVRTPFVTVDENDPSIICDGHERMWMISKKNFYEANVEKTRLGRLIQCWILGDIYLAGAFQNAIMNELVAFLHNLDLGKRHGGMPLGEIWDDVFEQTTEHSKLRNFVADALYANMSTQTFREACAMNMFDVEDLRDALLEAGLNVRQSMTAGRAPWAYGVDKKIYHVKVMDWHAYYGMYGRVEDQDSKDLRAQVPGFRNMGCSTTFH